MKEYLRPESVKGVKQTNLRMYTCIIVDDLQSAVNLIKKHVLKIPQLSIMLTATDSIAALTFLDNNKPDIIFLDIEMPGMDGIDFTRNIKEKWGNNMPKIVFTTGHTEYLLDGYEHGVADYLLKPILFGRFKQCVDRIIAELDKRNKPTEQAGFFFADNEGEKVKIDIEDIIYVEGKGNYISIVTDEYEQIVHKSMNTMQDFLPADKFIRVHRSYILAINRIRTVKGNEIFIKTKNNTDKPIPIGVTFRENALKQLGIKF
jgi:DNA-binding LytR/AlgR family response regulator